MSLALIQESAKEVRRLAIAGSALAVGDFRLKKLGAPLEQAGTKVPVFAQVAKAINEVVNGKEADSAANLLALSTLLNAILYTQGQSGTDAAFRPMTTHASTCSSTRTSARMLKPLIQALVTTGGGRIEIVKTAIDQKAFNDLRLIDPAIYALGDPFPELADLVAEKVLPGFGPGIIPRLKDGLDLKGKRQDARRLQIIHQLDPQGTLELCKSALDDGSPEVKVAAIECLGKHSECLPLVIEQAKSKNKQLRAAALKAVAAHDRPEITSLFTELIKGKALDILVGPFRALRNAQVLNSLVEEGKRVFSELLKGDSEPIGRFWEIIDCLDHRKDKTVESFLLECFNQGDKVVKLKALKNSHLAGDDLVMRLATLLYQIGSERTLEAILNQREVLPPPTFGLVLRSALRRWPPDRVFDEFSPLLAHTKGVGKQKCSELEGFFTTAAWDEDSRFRPPLTQADVERESDEALRKITWDPRWLDAAVKADQRTMVCSLARPGHPAALSYLLNLGESKKTSDSGWIIRALVRCGYPAVTDVFIKLATQKSKVAKYLDYELQFLFECARLLPAADLPKLDAFAGTLDEKFMDAFLEAVAPLRATGQK